MCEGTVRQAIQRMMRPEASVGDVYSGTVVLQWSFSSLNESIMRGKVMLQELEQFVWYCQEVTIGNYSIMIAYSPENYQKYFQKQYFLLTAIGERESSKEIKVVSKYGRMYDFFLSVASIRLIFRRETEYPIPVNWTFPYVNIRSRRNDSLKDEEITIQSRPVHSRWATKTEMTDSAHLG